MEGGGKAVGESIVAEFRAYLSKRYGEASADILAALSISCVMNSVISEFGIRYRAPIAIVANSDYEMDLLREDMRVFNSTPFFSLTNTWKQFSEKIVRSHDDVAIAYFQGGAESEKKLQLLSEAIQGGRIEDEEIDCVCVVLFEKFIPHRVIGFFKLVIVIPEDCTLIMRQYDPEVLKKFRRFLVTWVLDKFAVLEHELAKTKKSEAFLAQLKQLRDGEVLLVAGRIFALLLEEEGADSYDWEMNFAQKIQELMVMSENMHSESDIGAVFVEGLYAAVNHGVRVISKQEVEGGIFREIDQIILYDQNYYYLSDVYFCKLCKLFGQHMPIAQIKEQLSEEGILAGNGGTDGKRGYYTVKIALYTSYGNRVDLRVIRLRREKVDQPGCPELCDLSCEFCREEGEKNDFGKYIEWK